MQNINFGCLSNIFMQKTTFYKYKGNLHNEQHYIIKDINRNIKKLKSNDHRNCGLTNRA